MQNSTSDVLNGAATPYGRRDNPWIKSFSISLNALFSKLNFLAKYHPEMIGVVDAVDKEAQVVSIVDPRTRRRLKVKYDSSFEKFLTTSINEIVEIGGKFRLTVIKIHWPCGSLKL